MSQSELFFNILCLTVMLRTSYSNNNTLLIVVSFDGFRYDYFDRNLSDTFVNLRMKSSHAPYMQSVFPTKTFSNHFSIATGLYTEVHGVLDNKVYDQSTNKTLGYGYELFHYNDDVVPLWILNERGGGGRRSGCMMWPGSNFKYQDTFPSHYMSYNATFPWKNRVDILLGWFKESDTPINLGMLYFEQPDLICHMYGPDSEQVNREIAHADRILQYLFEKAEAAGLLSRLNIVFLSDHGGQAVKIPDNIINLNDFVNETWYRYDGVPPNFQIYPVKGKEAEVVEALQSARNKTGGNFSTYTRDEIPEHWHYKNCNRTPPVLLTADLGFLFLTTDKNYTSNPSVIGTHGYDPKEPTMRAFFIATGPLFKRNYSTKPFENIHIYPLAAHILGLSLPSLQPNGSLAYLQDILVAHTGSVADNDGTAYLVAGLIISTVCVVTLFSWFIVRRSRLRKAKMRKSSSASYKVLTQRVDEEGSFDTRETISSDCDDDSQT